MANKVQVFRDKNKKWRVRLRSSNGRTLGHEYNQKQGAVKTANMIAKSKWVVEIKDDKK